jgi:phospholipase A1
MKWKFSVLQAIIFLLPCSGPVYSASDSTACASIKDNAERLECYDKLSRSNVNSNTEVNKESIVENRLEQESLTSMNEFAITPHKPNYLLPLSYDANINQANQDAIAPGSNVELQKVEAKFQLSFKVPLVKRFLIDNGQLWFAYSQLAFWQMYNRDLSSPFREINYEPELIWAIKTDKEFLGLHNAFITLALNHQSNGQSEPLSRSWNRIVADFIFEKENLVLSFKPWYRIPESEEDDDNPDIDEYLGYADFSALYKYKEHLSTVMLRNNLRSDDNRTTIELTYTFEFNKRLKGIAQYFSGYGESLIDYNHRTHRFGVGILLTDWL